jgi:hypothetical protein
LAASSWIAAVKTNDMQQQVNSSLKVAHDRLLFLFFGKYMVRQEQATNTRTCTYIKKASNSVT